MSFDDGDELDVKAIALMKKYGYKDVTFFVPINSWGFEHLETYKDYKVGGHTFTHPQDLKILDDAHLHYEVIASKKVLDEALGYETDIFCYPRGRYDKRVLEYVQKAGYKKARVTAIGLQSDNNYEIKGFHFYQRKEYGETAWVKYILNAMDRNSFRYFNLWGHSKEIEKNNDWDNVELLLKTIKKDYGHWLVK